MSIPKVITAKTRVKIVLVEAIGEPSCSALKQSRDRQLWRERELLKGSRDLQRSIVKSVALCCWPLMFHMLTLSPSAMKPPCPSLPSCSVPMLTFSAECVLPTGCWDCKQASTRLFCHGGISLTQDWAVGTEVHRRERLIAPQLGGVAISESCVPPATHPFSLLFLCSEAVSEDSPHPT